MKALVFIAAIITAVVIYANSRPKDPIFAVNKCIECEIDSVSIKMNKLNDSLMVVNTSKIEQRTQKMHVLDSTNKVYEKSLKVAKTQVNALKTELQHKNDTIKKLENENISLNSIIIHDVFLRE